MIKALVTIAVGLFCTICALAQSTGTPPPATTSTTQASASPTPTPANSASPAEPEKVAATTGTNGNASSTTATTAAPAAKGAVVLPPEKANPVTIPKFDKPPVIDGKLDDEVWTRAAVLKDFYQIDPGDNIAPSKPTQVYLGYDAKFLYIAFSAEDEQDKIRSTVAKRDSIFQDDYVGFFLDTFNDKRKAFEAFFNPLGIQADGVLTEGRGEDFSVDLLMESKGTIHEKGYIVEIAIPFKSLRYEAGKGKLWGAHFFRRIQRFNREMTSWMPFQRGNSSNLSQAGHLTGLEGIAAERTLELIPSLTLSQSGRFTRTFGGALVGSDPGRLFNEPFKFDPGLTAKFIPSPAVTVDLALNPDFAQVEADQLVVDVNQRFPIFFAEKRPFFLEGIDIFRTPITAVHTRAIVDPDIAVKTTGKIGRNTFGLMVATDNGPGNLGPDDRELLKFTDAHLRTVSSSLLSRKHQFSKIVDKNALVGVMRLKRDIGKESSLGILATTYNFVEKHNDLVSIDGRFRFDKKTTWSFQLLGTSSRNFFLDLDEGRSRYGTGNGFGYATNYSVSGRHWGYEFGGEGFTRRYRADVGFFQRTNSNFNYGFLRYNSDPKPKNKIISYHIHNFTHIDYNWQGRIYAWETENLIELSLPRSSWIGVWWEPGYERLFEEEFGPTRNARCITDPDPAKRCRQAFFGHSERSSMKQHISTFFGSNFNKKIQFNGQATYRFGHFDLDFGNGRKYPRVSPAALALGQGAPLDPGRGNLLQVNGGITFQPTNELRMQFNLNKQRLRRNDTGLLAFDINLISTRATYQFTKATFARVIMDYDTLRSRLRSQALLGWTPSPGTAFYAGYNDDSVYASPHPFTGQIVPGFRRNSRVFFIKMSYLIRKSFGS